MPQVDPSRFRQEATTARVIGAIASATRRRVFFCLCIAALIVCAGEALAGPLRVCTFSFNSSNELAVVKSHLPTKDFTIVDLSPSPAVGGESTDPARLTSSQGAGAPATNVPSWLLDQCRPDLQCDVVVYSGEFAGGFFGRYGTSIRLQAMEEAACQPRCQGLFHHAREVFLLACNTLASKDQDSRTPEEYLQVLLDHGFDRSSAERAVDLRYGPLGPSFRESIRRIFMGVPRIYGFSSVAPRGEWMSPRLSRYFQSKGNYRRYLQKAAWETDPNKELQSALGGTSFVQMTGLTPLEPGALSRGVICSLYDDTQSVAQRLRTVRQLFARRDFLAFLPTVEVFLSRHPAEHFRGEERRLFSEIQKQDAAREQVLRLVHDLNVSAQKMELAHLALQLGWISKDELRRLAVDSAKTLLTQPLSSDVVDIMCEITKHEAIGAEFASNDVPQPLFADAEWFRLVDCLSPSDPRVSARLVRGLNSSDTTVRLWAAYALSRRLPLEDAVLQKLATHLDDPSPDVRARLQWIFRSQRSLSDDVRQAVREHDPQLAATLLVSPG